MQICFPRIMCIHIIINWIVKRGEGYIVDLSETIVSEGNKSCSMSIPDIKVLVKGENKGTFYGVRYNKVKGKCNQVRTT